MTGVNQTILMCLSMVVIASLIGAKGLGQDVLIALQYAAKGQGMLAGLAILFCAMVIDRIIQGTLQTLDLAPRVWRIAHPAATQKKPSAKGRRVGNHDYEMVGKVNRFGLIHGRREACDCGFRIVSRSVV